MKKIFLSHSSKDSEVANAFKEYLFSVGVDIDRDLYFTSDRDTGIPLGYQVLQDIHINLRQAEIVILMLSENYYKSAYCMNEMGATWILEKQVIPFILPVLKDKTKVGVIGDNAQYGVIDKQVLNTFYDTFLKGLYISRERPTNAVEAARDKFLQIVNEDSEKNDKILMNEEVIKELKTEKIKETKKLIVKVVGNSLNDLIINKFSEQENLLIKYLIDLDKVKLMCGWQEQQEVDKIIVWQEINELNRKLSSGYRDVLSKFEIRGLLEVSQTTGGGNPKEYQLKKKVIEQIDTLLEEAQNKLNQVIQDNLKNSMEEEYENLPF
ncbi:MAG: toll/interleukin-1 receptor domain-containing protein [Clostridiales bacterium]|nr:toll/interleukin-1 receptor domain-containing protein [Clostridiales bacterium]